MTSSAPNQDRLEALARKKGWRLEWRTERWPFISRKASITAIEFHQGKTRVGGATITYFDGDQGKARENLAAMLLRG